MNNRLLSICIARLLYAAAGMSMTSATSWRSLHGQTAAATNGSTHVAGFAKKTCTFNGQNFDCTPIMQAGWTYQFFHGGHCARGWLGLNTRQHDAVACAQHCAANPSCGYFAHSERTKNCALYDSAAECPGDGRYGDHKAYKLIREGGVQELIEKAKQGLPLHPGDRVMKIVLMNKNERGMLEAWVDYHATLFGLGNLYIMDGSDEPETVAYLRQLKTRGCNVLFTNSSLNMLAGEMTSVMRQLTLSADFLVKLDTDEYFSVTGVGPSGVRRYLNSLPFTGALYKIGSSQSSIPPDACPAEALPRVVTHFRPAVNIMKKSIFPGPTFVSVDLGGHNGAVSVRAATIATDVNIVHYHCKCLEEYAQECETVLLSHGFIGPSDSDPVRIEKLEAHKEGPSWHKAVWYRNYLMNPSAMRAEHKKCSGAGTQVSDDYQSDIEDVSIKQVLER